MGRHCCQSVKLPIIKTCWSNSSEVMTTYIGAKARRRQFWRMWRRFVVTAGCYLVPAWTGLPVLQPNAVAHYYFRRCCALVRQVKQHTFPHADERQQKQAPASCRAFKLPVLVQLARRFKRLPGSAPPFGRILWQIFLLPTELRAKLS
jgi:hypothetical protein